MKKIVAVIVVVGVIVATVYLGSRHAEIERQKIIEDSIDYQHEEGEIVRI